MRTLYALRDFFFPPTCPGCYEIFGVKYGEKNELCPECKIKWELSQAIICPDCGERFSDCRCTTKALERAGVKSLIKLVPYRQKRAVSNNMVLYIKKRRDARVFNFLCTELSREIERYIKTLGVRAEDTVIAYCPRRRRAINEFGFDQARLLADGIAARMGLKLEHAIKRVPIFAKAQKKLNAKQRAKNVHGSFEISNRAAVKNKAVLLIDDLVTTGSTMAECARLLKGAGASLVIGVAVAATEKTIEQKGY